MKFANKILLAVFGVFAMVSQANTMMHGFTVTEIGEHRYDAILNSLEKTEAQLIVDHLAEIGVNHIILSPRATMSDPRDSFVTPLTPASERADERERYIRFITYIHSKGMTVGIRPIFFVVDENGNMPFVEVLPDGTDKVWWHGNVLPRDPQAWFASFREYFTPYLEIAKEMNIKEFTIGAELQSLTVGTPGRNMGYPEEFLNLLAFMRTQLNPDTRIEYDINYTDERITNGKSSEIGGELAVWRQRIADTRSFNSMADYENWKNLLEFYRQLDGIGVDVYRSLADADDIIPEDYDALVLKLRRTTDSFVEYFDYALSSMWSYTSKRQTLTIKEIGFRSVTNGFVDPYTYAGPGELNIEHQAAAYEAIFQSFFLAPRAWLGGIGFWDASVDLERHGPFTTSFSPLGKELTESIILNYFTTAVTN